MAELTGEVNRTYQLQDPRIMPGPVCRTFHGFPWAVDSIQMPGETHYHDLSRWPILGLPDLGCSFIFSLILFSFFVQPRFALESQFFLNSFTFHFSNKLLALLSGLIQFFAWDKKYLEYFLFGNSFWKELPDNNMLCKQTVPKSECLTIAKHSL